VPERIGVPTLAEPSEAFPEVVPIVVETSRVDRPYFQERRTVRLTGTMRGGAGIAGITPVGVENLGTVGTVLQRAVGGEVIVSARHVVGTKGDQASFPGTGKVAGTVLDDDRQLDAAVVAPADGVKTERRLRVLEIVPRPPVMPWPEMPVQLVGARSGLRLGHLDQAQAIAVGEYSVGLVTHYRATIKAQRGDSGALLLTGHRDQVPIPEEFAHYMLPGYANALAGAMLGILVAGPAPGADGTTPPSRRFTPMLHILKRFDLIAEGY